MAKRFNGMIHGFLQFFVDQDAALEALDMINAFVQDKTLIPTR